jgi:TetR/AcrR family fatty acid metabolism transcriptional regulator
MQPGPGAANAQARTFIETARRAQIVAAAIDTIAEVGYARASFARIASRLGISRGLISYHFAGKDEMMKEVVREVIEQGTAYMQRRILAHTTGPEVLRAYIESNLEFLGEHQSEGTATVEIARNAVTADGQHRFYSYDIDEAVRALAHLLSGFQQAGQFRADFDPRAMAIAIRGALDGVSARLRFDPEFDIHSYTEEIASVFHLATRPDT